VVGAKRTRQGAGISNGGTTIRVTGRWNAMQRHIVGLKARRHQRECDTADAMARQESDAAACGTQSLNETSSGNTSPVRK
jgi:hypothetical protein